MRELSCLHEGERNGACVDDFPVGGFLPGTSMISRIYRFT